MTDEADFGTETGELTPETPRLARRLLMWGVALVLSFLLLLAVIRIFIPTIPPEQAAPEGHPGKPCVACHFVIEDAEEVEVE